MCQHSICFSSGSWNTVVLNVVTLSSQQYSLSYVCMIGSWKEYIPISFYTLSGSSSLHCFVTCLCLGNGVIWLFLFCFVCYHWGGFSVSWILGVIFAGHGWWAPRENTVSFRPIICRWPKLLVRLRKFKLVFNRVWDVIGLLYLLTLFCLFTKWEVIGQWEEEDGVIRARGMVQTERKTSNNVASHWKGWEPVTSGQDPSWTIDFVQRWRMVGN